MSWITLSETELITRLSGPEDTAYRSAAKKSGQADPLTEILDGVVQEVRARCAAGNITLGDGKTVPEELEHHALAIARFRLITRLPVRVNEERKTEYRDAMAILRDVAAGKYYVEEPLIASEQKLAGPTTEVVCERTRRAKRSDLDGLT